MNFSKLSKSNKFRISLLIVIIILFWETVCCDLTVNIMPDKPEGMTFEANNKPKEKSQIQISEYMANNSGDEVEIIKSIYRKIIDLSKRDGINDVIITVNGYDITRMDFEAQKISQKTDSPEQEKEILYSLIKKRVLTSEAERLKIEPMQSSINDYMEQTKIILEEGGRDIEALQMYIDASYSSTEEYLIELEKSAYYMFQRDALRQYVEGLKKYDSFEEYVAIVIYNADIEFYDSEIEELYKS